MSRSCHRRRKPVARTRRLLVEQLEGRRLLASVNWDGAPNGGGVSVDNKWRTGSNWAGDQVYSIPISDIEFPAGAANLSNFNDYAAGSLIGSILLSGSGYTLQGNGITMGAGAFNGLTSTIPAGTSNTISLPIALAVDQTWASTTAGSTLDMSGGSVDLRGFNLTVNGSGTTILGPITDPTDASGNNGIIAEGGTVVLSGDSTAAMFVGVDDSTVQVLGSATQTLIDMNGGTLTTDAAATTGPINVLGVNGGRIAPGGVGTTGILSTQGNVVLSGIGNFGISLAIDLNGPTVGSGYDALHVTGTASLGGLLNPNVGSASTTGSSYTILTATAGVSGTFIGLNDLDKFTANGRTFQIDYTPNSVVLTDVTVEYVVNDNSDAADANTADGLCDTNLATPGLQCSFRAAIQESNVFTDLNPIKFNIPGTGVHTISPATALPTITNPATIDGYTQPGAVANTNAIDDPDPTKRGLNGSLLIQLTGLSAGAAVDNGLTIAADKSIVRGLVINGFTSSGIKITGNDNLIAGNYLGTDTTGTAAAPNGKWGVALRDGASRNIVGTNGDAMNDAAERNLISGNGGGGVEIYTPGTDYNVVAGNFIGVNAAGTASLGNANRGVDVYDGPQHNRIGANADGVADGGERNIISGNGWEGLAFYHEGTSFNVIAGNFVGTDVTGTVALANARSGIAVWGGATLNTVGGTTTAARNVFSGNMLDGIEISSAGTADNIVEGNFSGTDSSGALPLGNARDGIRVWHGAVRTTIGGTAAGSANMVAFNKISGVAVLSSDAVGNAILGNSIFKNVGLGIDISENGVTPNDPGDADTGPNNLQNFPVINYATSSAGKLKVTYNVPSATTNSTYPIRVEFFRADAKGQGQVYLGFDTFSATDFQAGEKTVTLDTAAPAVSEKIVSTATDSLVTGGPANTSEFSASVAIASPWLNPAYRVDAKQRFNVNADPAIAADDVLAIINYINAKGSGKVPDNATNAKPYYDVTGDNSVAADDVVAVINYLNSKTTAEGEATSTEQPSLNASLAAVDEVLELLLMEGPGPKRK